MTFFRSTGKIMGMLRTIIPLVTLFLLMGSCSAGDYYFESLTYNIESSPRGTSYTCSLQFVSLLPDLDSIEVTIPFGAGETTALPIAFLGKTQVVPIVTEEEGQQNMKFEFDGMKVGQVETLTLRYSVDQGTALEAGARVEVRTFGLGGDVTTHALNLKLPRGFTVSRIETSDGTLRSGRAGIPLDLGREPVVLYFVLRKTTILDNRYVSLGLTLGCIAVAVGGVLYVLYRKKLIFKGSGKGKSVAGGSPLDRGNRST